MPKVKYTRISDSKILCFNYIQAHFLVFFYLFRSVPQITIIHTGISILRNGTELKFIIVCFRPSCINTTYALE